MNIILENEFPLIFPSPDLNSDMYGYNAPLSYLILPLILISVNTLENLKNYPEALRIFKFLHETRKLDFLKLENSRLKKTLDDVLYCCNFFLQDVEYTQFQELKSNSESANIEQVLGCLSLCMQNGSIFKHPVHSNQTYRAIPDKTSGYFIRIIHDLQTRVNTLNKALKKEQDFDSFLINYFVNINAKNLFSVNYRNIKFRQFSSLLVSPYNERSFVAKTLNRQLDLQILYCRRIRRLYLLEKYCEMAKQHSNFNISDSFSEIRDYFCDPEVDFEVDNKTLENLQQYQDTILNIDQILPIENTNIQITSNYPCSLGQNEYLFRFSLKFKQPSQYLVALQMLPLEMVVSSDKPQIITVPEQTSKHEKIEKNSQLLQENFQENSLNDDLEFNVAEPVKIKNKKLTTNKYQFSRKKRSRTFSQDKD